MDFITEVDVWLNLRGGKRICEVEEGDTIIFILIYDETGGIRSAFESECIIELPCMSRGRGDLPGGGTEYKSRRKSKGAGATLVEERVGERKKNEGGGGRRLRLSFKKDTQW